MKNKNNIVNVYSNGYLKIQNILFKCSLGKNNIKKHKIEGDYSTPSGKFKIVKIFYRADKIKNISSLFKLYKIKKNDGWCDDINARKYNRYIKLPCSYSHEKLWRNDKIYDVIIVLDYNYKSTIRGKGSAIFIHIKRGNYEPTKGCIGISKKNITLLLKKISKKTIIKINKFSLKK